MITLSYYKEVHWCEDHKTPLTYNTLEFDIDHC